MVFISFQCLWFTYPVSWLHCDSQQAPKLPQKLHFFCLNFRFNTLWVIFCQTYLVMSIHLWNLWMYTGTAVHWSSSNLKITLDHPIKLSCRSNSDFYKENDTCYHLLLHYHILPLERSRPKPDLNQNRDLFLVCEVLVALFPCYC